MTTIYSQLRVSCGLSATLNSLQPELLKATTTQTLAHWLDVQWLKLTNNNSSSDPLVGVGEQREWRWAIVFDYILLRKIRSSLLLCHGLPPGQLILELEEEHLDWRVLTPAFTKILTRLAESKEDWPLWQYDGDLDDPATNLTKPEYRRKAVKLIMSIKGFYEIYESNLNTGPEGAWKGIFGGMVGFPEELTHNHVIYHIDHYKTDFELGALLQSLGYELDNSSGRGYPNSVIPNSIVLINRPEHWVCEDSRARGTVLDSLTQGTDAIHAADSFNYYKPIKNLRILRKSLPKLEKIFPDIEVEIDEEDLTEFPDLDIPETTNPDATAQQFHHTAAAAYAEGNFKKALIEKKIECTLLEKGSKGLNFYQNLLEFSEWCIKREKLMTAEENMVKLGLLEQELSSLNISMKAKKNEIHAKLYMMQDKTQSALLKLSTAFSLYKEAGKILKSYEIANSIGVAYSRAKKNQLAIKAYSDALEIVQTYDDDQDKFVPGEPRKYWPGIIRALEKKIKYLRAQPETNNPASGIDAIQKVE
jgi:tetratricopeptide (TPR) repeat protein